MSTTALCVDIESAILDYTNGRYNEAFNKFLVLASSQNNAKAQFYLGKMYRYGQGIEIDLQNAKHWFKVSCNNGDTVSCFQLQSF